MTSWQKQTALELRTELTSMGHRQIPSNRDGFDDEFDALRAVDHKIKCNRDEFYSASLGSNMSKNRFRDVLPNEGTRVCLEAVNQRGDGDYINANFVDARRLFGVPFVYIATQAPLQSTIADFWRMVYENNTAFIVMLCAEIESGKVKSERYWPDSVGDILPVGSMNVVLVNENHRNDTIFRTIALRTSDGSERTIHHLQYIRWPDQGIPHHSAGLIEIIYALGKSPLSTQTPVVVHCSAGAGRTGTFLTMHIALALFQLEQPVSIPRIVQYLKYCRTGCVQRKDQYLYCYYAVLREMEKMIWAAETARQTTQRGLPVPLPGAGSFVGVGRRENQHMPRHPAQSVGTIDRGLKSVVGQSEAARHLQPTSRNIHMGAMTGDVNVRGVGYNQQGDGLHGATDHSIHASANVMQMEAQPGEDAEDALERLRRHTQRLRSTPSRVNNTHQQNGGSPPNRIKPSSALYGSPLGKNTSMTAAPKQVTVSGQPSDSLPPMMQQMGSPVGHRQSPVSHEYEQVPLASTTTTTTYTKQPSQLPQSPSHQQQFTAPVATPPQQYDPRPMPMPSPIVQQRESVAPPSASPAVVAGVGSPPRGPASMSHTSMMLSEAPPTAASDWPNTSSSPVPLHRRPMPQQPAAPYAQHQSPSSPDSYALAATAPSPSVGQGYRQPSSDLHGAANAFHSDVFGPNVGGSDPYTRRGANETIGGFQHSNIERADFGML